MTRRTPDQEIWCLVTKVDHRFALLVSQDPEKLTPSMAGRRAAQAMVT